MNKPQLRRLALNSCIGLAIGIFFPTWMYLLYKVGAIDSKMSNGVEIVMKDGWFPLMKNGSFVQNFLGATSKNEANIMFCKATTTFGHMELIVFFELPKDAPSMDESPAKSYFSVKKYPWGTAWITDFANVPKMRKDDDSKWTVIMDGYRLSTAVKDLGELNEIIEIKAPRV